MQRGSHVLTAVSVIVALTGLGLAALAGMCTDSLPGSKAIPGWLAMDGSTKSGSMGSKASFDAYDGAVEHMRDDQGVRYFAQRIYKRPGSTSLLTLDVFQLAGVTPAQKMYAKAKADYRKAKSLSSLRGVKDQALVCVMSGTTIGCCQRGKYFCQVLITGTSAQDLTAARDFLTYASKKLGS